VEGYWLDGCFSAEISFLVQAVSTQGPVGWGFRGCEPHEVLQQVLRRCVERAVVADHERHARAGKAFNMHRIRLSAGAPHGHQQTLFIESCVPKRDARAGASEALRLCKFRASVPSGSPLFLSRESLRSYHGCCHHSPRRPWRADGRHNRTHSARKQSPQPRRRSICDQQPQSAVRLSGSWPARGSATASPVMGLAIRAWARRFTINVPATTYSVATHCRPDWSQ